MPAKLHTICYLHNCSERNTNEFILKEITVISRLNNMDPAEIIYLRIKVFIPLNQEVENNIEDFENEQVIFLKGKFIAHEGWYSVSFFFVLSFFSLIISYFFSCHFFFYLSPFIFLSFILLISHLSFYSFFIQLKN
jgi:hypothetical protein